MMTKIDIKQAIVINKPIEGIFAYMSNLGNFVLWSSVIFSIQATSSEQWGVGATVKSTIRFLGKWTEMTFVLVECQPNRFLTIKSTSGITPCLFHYEFEQLECGRTSIAQDIEVSLIQGLGYDTEQIVTNALLRDAKHDLLNLKDTLETRLILHSNVARA